MALVVASPAAASAASSSVWQVQTTVDPSGNQLNNSYFTGVSASGSGEAWAVGTYEDTNALDNPLAEHWNGKSWKNVAIPAPSGQQAVVSAVDDLAPGNAWAVGTSFSGGVGATPAGLTLIEHWNGTAWTIVPSPNPVSDTDGGADVLDAIAGTGPSDLWAAGWANDPATNTILMLFEHWNGTVWTAVTSPTPLGASQFVSGLTAVSSTNVWAVGNQGIESDTVAAHWNGSAWSIVPTPDFAGGSDVQNTLTAVSSDAAGDVWASGYASNVNGENFSVPYVLHWNGTVWTMTQVPSAGLGEGDLLRGIQVLSATDVWAVGQSQQDNGAILTLTEQFNGSAWSIVPSPDPGQGGGLPDNSLDSAGNAGGGSLFAVGAQEITGQCCLRTLAINTSQA